MTFERLMELLLQACALLGLGAAGVGVANRVKTAQSKEAAAARVDVAEAAGEERMHAGQTAELSRLQKLVEQMSVELGSLSRRVRDLEADVGVLETYFDAIILCDDCRLRNQKIIERTSKLFRKSSESEKPGTKPQSTSDGETCKTTAAFVGNERYQGMVSPHGEQSL